MKYQVGVKIYNSFEVEADSEEDAEMKVREMDLYDTFEHCDYNICYVDEIKPSMKSTALNKYSLYQSDGTLDETIICDDEHGNAL
tara:strand:- start:215 stop:469 length:255 start_codon:yes stop_codon:yes gene_type:complete